MSHDTTKVGILRFRTSFIVMLLCFCAAQVQAAPADLEQQFGPRPLDGVFVEALQSYSNPRSHHIGFDFGVWPLNPYYNGFSLDFNYTYFFNKNHAWEIVNFSYMYTVDTGLTTELADSYNVEPRKIERAEYIISSNYLPTLAYGKFIFFSDNIRYFRSNLVLGPALISTNEAAQIGVCVGWQFETFVNEKFSWKLGIRDNFSFSSSHPNNLVLTLGTSFGL